MRSLAGGSNYMRSRTNPSGIVSPSDIPDSPPRGSDDDIDTIDQQKTIIQPLNLTRSTDTTVIERTDNYLYDDNDVDSIKNYATSSPQRIVYDDNDDNDDNNSIHSSLSSLTLPLPPSSSTSSTTQTLLSNINDLRNLKHNLSIINEESLHEQNERQKSSFNISNTTITTTDDDDDEDEDEDQKGKRLLFELIRQRLPHHHISLTNTSNSSSKTNDIDCQDKSKGTSSTSSLSINDQTMREDSSNHAQSSHDITIPSSAMQESGYDSLLPIGSAPKRSLSNASLSTTRSLIVKKKHRCDEENDDPMNGIVSPSDIPDSPPRGSDDDIDTIDQQKTIIQPLDLTRSTGTTVIERTDNYLYDDNDVDSIKNYATSSPQRISYDDNDDNDDNNSIHSSLSSLTLPLPPSSSTSSTTQTLLSNINDLRNLKHNLSIINEESLHEQNERQKSSFNISNTTITTTDDDDEDEDEDQKGKRLLFELIRQRLPHHHISLTNTSDSSSKTNDIDCQDKSKGPSSTSSLSINDQVIFH
ncbi:unnamed protein product [Rotaria sp. Silwood1]|nr:unnamed protein product [Rotaria sp. Silwood1]